MKVSIGIPFYNAERFLHLAISSVLNQSFKDFELILTDDGSKDNSLEIAKSFNDNRIRLFSDGQNLGISYRLNEQINLAEGKFFARMDADDIMDPERIEVQLRHLEDNPLMDVIGSSAIIIDDNNNIIGLRFSNNHHKIESVFRSVNFIHPTIMGKTSWFKTHGYMHELKGVEDFDLWIRSFNYSFFSAIERPLLFYRDPPELKIKTYRFRQKQMRKALWANRKLLNKSPQLLVFLFLMTYFKTLVMNIFKLGKFEKILIKRRNKSAEKKSNENFQQRLNEILINC